MAQTFQLPTMIAIDGTSLSDESREGISMERDERVIDKQLATGKKIKFILNECLKLSISWENLADKTEDTVDGGAGAEFIRDIAMAGDEVSVELRFLNGETETYTMYVESHTQTVKFRRPGHMRYRVELGLEEVG